MPSGIAWWGSLPSAIFSALAARHSPLDETPVTAAMTCDVVTAGPGDSIEETMQLMTEHRCASADRAGRRFARPDLDRRPGQIAPRAMRAQNHYLKTYIQS